MQRKIGYGLIGASLALFLLLGAGLAWRSSALAVTDAGESVIGEAPHELGAEIQPNIVLPPPSSPIIIQEQEMTQFKANEVAEEVAPELVLSPEDELAQLFGETDDPQQILKALTVLVEREQAILIPEGGWYHFESTYFWGENALDNSSGDYHTADEGVVIPRDNIIPQVAWSNSYIRYNSDKRVLEGISILGEFETKTIKQLSIVDDGSWVNLTLQQAGDPHHRGPILAQPFTFPTREQRAEIMSLVGYPDNLEMSAFSNEDGHYIVHTTFHFPMLVSAPNDESATAVSKTEQRVFDMVTGQLLSRESYFILDNGRQDLILSETIVSQQVIQALPTDIERLYEQSKPNR